jgi:restriction system protein
MALYLVRAGKHGEQEHDALDHKVSTIGWTNLPDLNSFKSKEDLRKHYELLYPNLSPVQIGLNVGQVWRFYNEIKEGDYIAIPLKTQSAIAVGRVIGKYEYKNLTENIRHLRRVKDWKIIPRTAFDQDVLYSMGSLLTVCLIERNDAEKKVLALTEKRDYDSISQQKDRSYEIPEEKDYNIEDNSLVQIEKFIEKKFKGHELTRLVDAILKAQGFLSNVSSPGPDGGVDILAGSGALGFDSPKICVQVKSSTNPADVKVIRELQGTMSNFKSDQGLFVAWGGFNKAALKEAREKFFTIRLWDSGQLIENILRYYEKFSDELKAELPLKRIWSLVVEEE